MSSSAELPGKKGGFFFHPKSVARVLAGTEPDWSDHQEHVKYGHMVPFKQSTNVGIQTSVCKRCWAAAQKKHNPTPSSHGVHIPSLLNRIVYNCTSKVFAESQPLCTPQSGDNCQSAARPAQRAPQGGGGSALDDHDGPQSDAQLGDVRLVTRLHHLNGGSRGVIGKVQGVKIFRGGKDVDPSRAEGLGGRATLTLKKPTQKRVPSKIKNAYAPSQTGGPAPVA